MSKSLTLSYKEEKIALKKQKEIEEAELEKQKQELLKAEKMATEERNRRAEEDAKIKAEEEATRQKEKELALANEEKDFKASCTGIAYNKLEKNPYAYTGENVYYRGKVEQAGSEFLSEWFRVSVTPMGYGYYSDTMWLEYDNVTEFVEGDVVRFWGVFSGQHCYKSQLGADICIPSVNVKYMSK